MSLAAGYALLASAPMAKLGEALVHRICVTRFAGREPEFRAAGRYRFDDPNRHFGTLYCARDFGTCFLETLLRARGSVVVPHADYALRATLLLLLDTNQLRLVDFFSTAALAVLGLDLADAVSGDYRDSQRLAALVHAHSDGFHGIVYRSRFDPEQAAMVLFDRAKPLVRRWPGSKPLALTKVTELSDAVRNRVPFKIV